MIKFIPSMIISTLFMATPVFATQTYCVTSNSSDTPSDSLTLDYLVEQGQYPLALEMFGLSGSSDWSLSLTHNDMLLVKALYKFREICANQTAPHSEALRAHLEFLTALERTADLEKLPMMAELWSESKHVQTVNLPFGMVDYIQFIIDGKNYMPVQTILLLTGKHSFTTQAIETIKTFMAGHGIRIIHKNPATLTTALEEVVVNEATDLVITDQHNFDFSLFDGHVFFVGKSFGDYGFSMDYDKELNILRDQLLVMHKEFAVLGFSDDKDFTQFQSETETHPGASDFSFFKIKKREDVETEIQRARAQGNSSFLIIGDTEQTIYINNMLRLTQPVEQKKESLFVVVTSKSTWNMSRPKSDMRDLLNAHIFDSSELLSSGGDLSRSARAAALIYDISTIYELSKAGVFFSDFSFIGLTGNYRMTNGNIVREITISKVADYISVQ